MANYYQEYLKLKRQQQLNNDGIISPDEWRRVREWQKTHDSMAASMVDEYNAKKFAKKQEQDEGLDFFDSGAFGDNKGNFFTDLADTIGGTVVDFAMSPVKGLLNIGEGIVDLAMYGVGGVADFLGADGLADGARNAAKYEAVNSAYDAIGINDKIEDSVFGKTSQAILEGVGQVGGMMISGGIAGAAGLSGTAVTAGSMFASSAGQGISEAYKGGATDGEATAYGLTKGAIDAATEMMFGGLGKGVNALGYNRGLLGVDDMLASAAGKAFKSKVGKTIAQMGIKATAEGVEELAAGYLTAHAKKGTYQSEEEFEKILNDEKLLEQFIVGTAVGGIMQGGNVSQSLSGRDMITGLTENEQMVLDKEIEDRIKAAEESGNELNNKDKKKIREDAKKDLERGYISIDTIESALSPQTYDRYKKVVDSESKLENEISELENMPNAEITVKQSERLHEARKELEELRTKDEKSSLKSMLNEEVRKATENDSYLVESYNERARRGKKYEANVEEYDEAQRETIQKAIDSGILNNTNKTHAFVDLMAKLAADKGLKIDFANNKKIQESGFAVEGKTINGYVQGDNIVLNVSSDTAIRKVVGHEITHILEGTEMYAELQEAVKQYAETKGEYEAHLQEIQSNYQNVENANIENELTSDLVGEYLFTDEDFVNNLSTKKPNIFKRIYNEIKYFVKQVMPGSQEAKQLEKVKRMFDKAYKENVETQENENVKYSLYANYKEEVDKWYNDENEYANAGGFFKIGRTSEALKSIDVKEQEILFDKAKIKKILKEHDGMSIDIIKEVPNIVESPILVMQSKTVTNSITLFGEVYADGVPVMVAMQLKPKGKGSRVLNIIKIASAYERSDAQGLIDTSDILYVEPNKNRTDTWLRALGLQLPAGLTTYGPIAKVTYYEDVVKNESVGNNVMREALAKMQSSSENTKFSLSSKDGTTPNDPSQIYGSDIIYDPTLDESPMIEDDLGPVREVIPMTPDDMGLVRDDLATSDGIIDMPDDLPIRDDLAPNQDSKPISETNRIRIQNLEANIADMQLTLEERTKQFDKEIQRLFDEYDALKNKTTKKAGELLRKADNIKLKKANFISEIERRIAKTQERIKNLKQESEKSQIITRKQVHAKIIDNAKASFQEEGYDLDEVLMNSKEIGTFRANDNTPQRYMEKNFGYKEGQLFSDLTVNQTAKNESDGIRWLNSFTDRINGRLAQISNKYGIKPYSKEDAAAQMYGEGFWVDKRGEYVEYGDAELARDFPDIETQNRIKALANDSEIREIYDNTLEMINNALVRNGYDPIPKRKNYFLHFMTDEDVLSRWGLPFNAADIKSMDLPTDIAGRTADLKPGRPYFASANRRMGKRTSYSLFGGVERYLTTAKNTIFHTDDIQVHRALRNYVADMFGQAKGFESLDDLSEAEQEQRIKDIMGNKLSVFAAYLDRQANRIAGKTAMSDRGIESVFGRRGIMTLHKINSQVARNMVGYNIGSAFTNFISGIQAFAKANNKFDAIKAFTQTTSNRINKMFGRETDGFVEANDAMVRRKGAEKFYRKPMEKVADFGFALMGAIDNITTECIVRMKYNELTRLGVESEQAHDEAGKWAMRILGDRSLGQMPQLFDGKLMGFVTKFQLEVRNQLDSMFYDTKQEVNQQYEDIENVQKRNAKKVARIASTMVQLAVFQHLFGKAFESVAGYNPTFDIVEALLKLFGFDDDDDSEDTVLDNAEEAVLSLVEDLSYSSLIMGGGRIPMSAALPIKEFASGTDSYGNEKPRGETLLEAIPYYVLPSGYGQIKKTVQGLSMFDDDLPISGSYTNTGNLRYAVEDTPLNRIQAGLFGQWANENAQDYIDNERQTMKSKQIEEFAELHDLGMTQKEYWDYREGLKDLDTIEEKVDYIVDLDLSTEQKNIMVSNAMNRTGKVDFEKDLSISDYEELGYEINILVDEELEKKQTKAFEELNELGEIGMTKAEYDRYQKGIASQSTIQGKFDYVSGLDIPVKQKNVLLNSVLSLKEKIDVSNYDDFSEYEEFDFYLKNPEKHTLSKAIGTFKEYTTYTKALNSLKSDKDESGNSISGSIKQKVLTYINGLDATYETKIILYKMEYPSDNRYNNEIIEYLNKREDISYKEMETILKELGFKVEPDGTIRW